MTEKRKIEAKEGERRQENKRERGVCAAKLATWPVLVDPLFL